MTLRNNAATCQVAAAALVVAFICISSFSTTVSAKGQRRLTSHEVHLVAMPRHKAVGMWLPNTTHLHTIRQHRHSMHAPKRVLPEVKTAVLQSSTSSSPIDLNADHEWLPYLSDLSLHGPGEAFIDYEELEAKIDLHRRITPYAIALAIKVVGPVLGTLGNIICYFLEESTVAKSGKVWCFIITNLISLLSGFGGHFTAKFFKSGGRVADILSGVRNSLNSLLPTQRDLQNSTIWYEHHLDYLKELYADSLLADKEMIQVGRALYDQNTGHMLTHWDIVMSHIHPIRHSYVKGLETSLWHETQDGATRRHAYTPLLDGDFELPNGKAHFGFSGLYNATTKNGKRQNQNQTDECAESDTEAGEPPAHDYCDQGTALPGVKGLYDGYHYTGTDGEANAIHLKLGNDTYAKQAAGLEGQLQYLGGDVEGVCENITDSGNQIYMGLRQIEGMDDNYIGYDNCHDVV